MNHEVPGKYLICSGCDSGMSNTPNDLKIHERIRKHDEPFRCAHCDKTFNVADKTEVRAYRKHRNFTNRLMNKISQENTGIDITEESSMNDCYKACEEVLRPEKGLLGYRELGLDSSAIRLCNGCPI